MDPSHRPRSVLLLGSTGSIGVQALDVIHRYPQRFRVVGLAAGGADPQALATQVLQTGAHAVAIVGSLILLGLYRIFAGRRAVRS